MKAKSLNLTETILKECCFISGGRGSGKSRLGMLLTQLMLQDEVLVKVIDSSRTWLKYSSVPQFVKVKKPQQYNYFSYYNLPNVWNCIYDCSRLSTLELREFVSGMMESDFIQAVILDERGFTPQAIYVLEECQNLIPNGSLRSNKFQEISRFVTQGRNFGLGYLAITQRLASTDTNLVEISGLKFFGKTEGQNTVSKAKHWVPKDLLIESRDYKAGKFIKQYGSKVTVEKYPLFTSPIKPQQYQEPKPVKQKSILQRIFG